MAVANHRQGMRLALVAEAFLDQSLEQLLGCPIAIFGFIGAANVRYGDIAAFSLLCSLPVFFLYAIISRLFTGGFTLGGALKG